MPLFPRREFIAMSSTASALAAFGSAALGAQSALTQSGTAIASQAQANLVPAGQRFRYCLNTSTIRGQKVGIVKAVELAAAAGYDGIEPWIDELDTYVKEGGSLPDLKKRIADGGLTVESAIGFAAFLVDDDAARGKGLDEAKRCMELVRAIGGTRIAAPPVGLTDQTYPNLLALGPRYRALLELGVREGVLPMIELWGFSKTLSHLGEVALVGIEAAPANPAFLLDCYHIYKGGSDFGGLAQFPGERMFVFHINDYPADPPRETIGDQHRVYPGDGVAPLKQLFETLTAIGFRGALSLELFNRDYWAQDAAEVCKTGLRKTRDAVAKALGSP